VIDRLRELQQRPDVDRANVLFTGVVVLLPAGILIRWLADLLRYTPFGEIAPFLVAGGLVVLAGFAFLSLWQAVRLERWTQRELGPLGVRIATAQQALIAEAAGERPSRATAEASPT